MHFVSDYRVILKYLGIIKSFICCVYNLNLLRFEFSFFSLNNYPNRVSGLSANAKDPTLIDCGILMSDALNHFSHFFTQLGDKAVSSNEEMYFVHRKFENINSEKFNVFVSNLCDYFCMENIEASTDRFNPL